MIRAMHSLKRVLVSAAVSYGLIAGLGDTADICDAAVHAYDKLPPSDDSFDGTEANRAF